MCVCVCVCMNSLNIFQSSSPRTGLKDDLDPALSILGLPGHLWSHLSTHSFIHLYIDPPTHLSILKIFSKHQQSTECCSQL